MQEGGDGGFVEGGVRGLEGEDLVGLVVLRDELHDLEGHEVVEVEVLEGGEGGQDFDDVIYSTLVKERKVKGY